MEHFIGSLMLAFSSIWATMPNTEVPKVPPAIEGPVHDEQILKRRDQRRPSFACNGEYQRGYSRKIVNGKVIFDQRYGDAPSSKCETDNHSEFTNNQLKFEVPQEEWL